MSSFLESIGESGERPAPENIDSSFLASIGEGERSSEIQRIQSLAKRSDKEVLDNLPDTLRVAFWDTGVPISDEVAASLVGAGHMMSDVYRGVKQIMGIDEESLAVEQQAMDDLYDSSLSTYAIGGAVVGALAEPLGFLIPATKGKGIAKAVGIGAAAGAGYGALSYVNEGAGQTRAANAAFGALLVGGSAGVIRKVLNTSEAKQVKKADELIDNVEKYWAQRTLDDVPFPDIQRELKTLTPSISDDLLEAAKITGRKARLPMKTDEALELLDFYNPTTPKVKSGGILENIAGIFSTRVKNISEEVFGKVRQHDYNIMTRTHEDLKRTDVFVQDYNKKVKGPDKATLDQALMNGEFDLVESILKRHGGDKLVEEFGSVRKVLDELGDEFTQAGRFKEKLPNYFPRYVKDYEGLLSKLGAKERSVISRTVDDANAKMIKARGYKLSPLEEGQVLNNAIRGYPIKAFKPSLAKERKIDKLTDDMMEFYATPSESLHTYIRNAIHDLEKLKFFGKDAKWIDIEGVKTLDISDSVGALLQKMGRGRFTASQEKELRHLLDVRFGIGERAPNKIVQDTKNIMYAALLGNPVSAVTQLGDIGVSIYLNGFRNSMKGLVNRKVKMEDFGLADNLAEEFATTSKTSKFLRASFKYGGFKAVDKLGKDTLLNSSLLKWQKLSRTEKGLKKLSEKYKGVFGDEFEQLALDLKSKKISENVKLFLFNELADIQPVSLSEMPEMYLRMPNGRVAYMLKTFMLKQADVIRRDAVQQIRKGNVAKGLSNLTRYALILGTANTGSTYIKDMMQGKEVEPEGMDIGENFLKMFGTGEYMRNKVIEGKPVEALMGITVPPFQMFDDILQMDAEAIKYMPIAGKVWYMWFGGGLEKAAEKKEQKEQERFFSGFNEYEE